MAVRHRKSRIEPDPVDRTHVVVEEVLEQKLSDIATVLYSTNGGKSRLHEDILSMVERSLFKIALQRNRYIKGAAAAYLGINRNTFQKKMVKLGLADGGETQRGRD